MTSWNIDLPGTQYLGVPADAEQLQQAVRKVAAQPFVAIDTETTGLVVWKDIPLYWSLAWPGHRMTLSAGLLPHFKEAFDNPSVTWILANAKYDMHILANVGIHLAGRVVDVQVMHALLHEDKPHNLKFIAQHILGWTWASFEDQFGKIGAKQTAEDVIRRAERENFGLLIEYAANDAWGTFNAYEKLRVQLEQAKTHSLFRTEPPYIETLWDLFWKVEVPYTKTLWRMERHGIKVDRGKLEAAAPQAEAEIIRIEREIAKIAGRVINIKSTPQLREWLINERGLNPIKWTKGGKSGDRSPSVDSHFLEHYQYEDPAVRLIMSHRDYSKLYGTYITGLHELLDPKDRIHTRYNQDTVRTGRLSSSNPNCFSGDTEVLTKQGWVRLDHLRKKDQVAQWDEGVIEFVEPTGWVEVPAEDLLHIELMHIDLKITPDHRCLLRSRKSKNLMVFDAKEYPEDYQQLHAGEYSGQGCPLSPEELCWLIAVQADGSISRYNVDFGLRKKRKIRRLVQLLDSMGAEYTNKPRADGRGRRILVHGSARELAVGYLGAAKQFGSWVLNLNREQLDTFCEEVWFWDGCWARRNHYASKYKTNADWVQAALSLSGKRARIRKYVNGQGSVSWQVDATNRDYSLTTNRRITKEPSEDGKAYCVSVPSSFLLVRRGGNVMVTGNCQNIPRPENDKWNLRSAFIPEDGYAIIAVDYEQLEMRLLAAAAMEPKMIKIFAEGKDIHTGNVEMVFGIPYEDVVKAKKIEKQVKSGELPESALTEYVQLCSSRRYEIKTIGFGLNYGMGAARLARQLGISQESAQAIINKYMDTYPAVKQFFAEAVAETRATGYAFTIMGRRRNVLEILSYRKDEEAQGQRIATNTQIQGSAADVCKMAQINIDKVRLEERLGCRQLLQVHDELVFECPEETADEALVEIVDLMEHPFYRDLPVRLGVDAGKGTSWRTAK